MRRLRVFSCVALVLSIAFPVVVQAQAVLYGTVTDGEGQGVSGANVLLEDLGRGTATDEAGEYRFSELSPGTYLLVVSSVGFQEVRRQVQVEAGERRRVDVSLEEAILEQGEVVVTGTMEETHVKESPVKVEAVSPQVLQRGAAASNVMDVIGRVNGVNQQLNCGVCYTNDIRINGVEGANTAVLIDGMPIMGALASVYGLNGISPFVIDQVEVIKGPQSTLYGTRALGGVVNILTKDPERTPTLSVHGFGDQTREATLEVAVSPEIGPVDGFLSGTAVHRDHFIDENGDGFSDIPQNTRVALFGKGALSGPEGARRLDVAVKYYDEQRTGGLEGFSREFRGTEEVYGEAVDTRRAELTVDYRPPTFGQQLRVSGALTHHTQESHYGLEHYDARQQIAYGQTTWRQPLGEDHQLLVGGTMRREAYDDNTPATSKGADRRLIPGIFAQGEFAVGQDVTLLSGLRLDHHGEHGWIPAPRLSAKYSPSDRTTLRLNGGTGFRVVNVFTEDHAALTGSREVVFRENLDPERSYSLTASLQHILPLRANPLTVEFDGFYTHFTNKIIPDYDQDPSLIVYENLDGHSLTQGLSVSLRQTFTALPLTYDAGITLMDVVRVEGSDRRRVTYAPDVTGNLSTSYELRDLGATVDYALSMVGSKRMPETYVSLGRSPESPAYSTHDVRLTKSFGDVNGPSGFGVEAYVAVENLFDYTQGSPLVAADRPFSEDFDTVYTWGPVVGRTVALGVRVNLR